MPTGNNLTLRRDLCWSWSVRHIAFAMAGHGYAGAVGRASFRRGTMTMTQSTARRRDAASTVGIRPAWTFLDNRHHGISFAKQNNVIQNRFSTLRGTGNSWATINSSGCASPLVKESFTYVPLWKFVIIYVPLKSSFIPLHHRMNFLLPMCLDRMTLIEPNGNE